MTDIGKKKRKIRVEPEPAPAKRPAPERSIPERAEPLRRPEKPTPRR